MKNSIYLSLVLFILLISCKKQELTADNPMIGKWKAVQYKIEDNCNTGSPSFYDQVPPIKKINIEITGSGEFISNFEGEEEKLKFVEIKESVSAAQFHMLFTAVKKYDCKVRNKKGQVFNFHFYFSEDTDQMVGTYWAPDHAYVTLDVPNHTFASCGFGNDTYEGYETEYFAVYQKI